LIAELNFEERDDMKTLIRFAAINFAVRMISQPLKRKTFIAFFNSSEDANEFKKYCNKRYPDLKFQVIEFDK
jgi:hypothetical protein